MRFHVSKNAVAVIAASMLVGWGLGTLIGRVAAQPPQPKARAAKNKGPHYHSGLDMPRLAPQVGKLTVRATMIIDKPNPRRKGVPESIVHDVVITVMTLDRKVLIDEKIGEFTDRRGVGDVRQVFEKTYAMPPGAYLARMTVHDPKKRHSKPDGTTEPATIAMAQRRVTVE